MGVIISGVRMISEPYNYILKKANDIHVYSLAKELTDFVNDSFEALKPLSYEYKEICQMKDEGYHDRGKLCIGTWLRTKYSGYYKYGRIVNDIIPYILKYGDELKPHVRRPIKDDFADLVDLTKKLKDYENIQETMEISPKKLYKYHVYESVNVDELVITELELNTSSPRDVIMRPREGAGEDSWGIDIRSDKTPAVLEDVIDNVVKLYNMVDAKLSVVRDHNQQIISQIDQIVTPHKLLKALK